MAKAEIVLGEVGSGRKSKSDSINITAADEYTISCGFQPSIIYVFCLEQTGTGTSGVTKCLTLRYDKDNIGSAIQFRDVKTSTENTSQMFEFPSTGNLRIRSISSDGFVVHFSSTFVGVPTYYTAIE